MKKANVILLFLVIAGTFWAGSWYGKRAIEPGRDSAPRKILYYVDPMNPMHTSDKPGFAPCGMALEPVYADGEGSSKEALSLPPGVVNIGPEKQQLIGVRVSQVEKAPSTRVLRVPGLVVPDEERFYKVNAAVDGWIDELSPVTTGSQVEKGQLLGSFSAPDLFGSAQQLLFAVLAMDHLAPGQESTVAIDPTGSNFLQRVEALLALGMSRTQIEEIRQRKEIPQSIQIYAPASGFVLARSISPGEKFEKGAEWYRIAELSQVWILADVFENDAQYLQPGKNVKVTLPRQGSVFQARVSTVLPQCDSTTRTLKVRLQAENPGFVLRPNMYVNVEFSIDLPAAISVPMDAVLDTGTRKTLFIDRGDGYFEPREVKTGWRFGDRVEVIEGLMEGERIVVSGNFLMDSESRMKLAAAGFQGARENGGLDMDNIAVGKAQSMGMDAPAFRQPGAESAQEDGHRKDPLSESRKVGEGSTGAAVPDPGLTAGFAKCPVCGMYIHGAKAHKLGLDLEYEGKKYTFCTRQCKALFTKSPGHYTHKVVQMEPGHESPAKGVARP